MKKEVNSLFDWIWYQIWDELGMREDNPWLVECSSNTKWVTEVGKWSIMWLNASPPEFELELYKSLCMMKLWPKDRWVIDGGRFSTVLLNCPPKWRWMSEGGRKSTISLNVSPIDSWMSDVGNLFTTWLNFKLDTSRWVREDWLK